MVGTPGHIALIVPSFARNNTYSLRGVGVYHYLGNHSWESPAGGETIFHLSFL
jgi:hypothetical protein